MVGSIESGLLKFSSTNPEGDLELKQFLEDIESDITEVLKIKEMKDAGFSDLMYGKGKKTGDEKPRLTNEEYAKANNCKYRRELFKTYFIDN